MPSPDPLLNAEVSVGVQQRSTATAATAAALQHPQPTPCTPDRPGSTLLHPAPNEVQGVVAWATQDVAHADARESCETAETSSSISSGTHRLRMTRGTWWRSRDAVERSHNPEVEGATGPHDGRRARSHRLPRGWIRTALVSHVPKQVIVDSAFVGAPPVVVTAPRACPAPHRAAGGGAVLIADFNAY